MNRKLENDDVWEQYYCMTPQNFSNWLRTKGGIVGQDKAVKAASMIMDNHIHGRASVNLFAAPSGSGKSYLYQVLQKQVGADKIVIHDASTLTATGWKGSNDIESIFRAIPPERRGRIILVLDELDKLLAPQIASGGTNHSEMVQNQLLRLCNHDTLVFCAENEQGFSVDTSGVSIVMLGAFEKLFKKKSRNSGSIGFGKEPHYECTYDNTEITLEDLVDCGMVRELAGRINRITCMQPLSVEDLTHIGQQEVKNLEQQLKRKISADYSVILNLAYAAEKKNFGARYLKSEISNAVDDLLYDNPHAEQLILDFNTLDVNDYKKPKAYIE